MAEDIIEQLWNTYACIFCRASYLLGSLELACDKQQVLKTLIRFIFSMINQIIYIIYNILFFIIFIF